MNAFDSLSLYSGRGLGRGGARRTFCDSHFQFGGRVTPLPRPLPVYREREFVPRDFGYRPPMSSTTTGSFPIAFRRGWSAWQKDSLPALAKWAAENGFAALDLMNLSTADVKTVEAAGIKVGSLDLLDFGALLSTDPAKRKDLVAKNVDYVKTMAAAGCKIFFTCVLPSDHAAKRIDNYKLAIESFSPIAAAADEVGAKIAIEGYPGGPPHYSSLCCTPETYRSFIKDIGTQSIGINYDPSHLIRLGVDPIRFVREFADRVFHVHAKDTEIIPEAVYEFGLYQSPVFTPSHGFGEAVWRYTIPGHGQTRWTEAFSILKAANYRGLVSIELEDERFNGSEAGEKRGLITSRDYLKSV